MGFVPPLQYNSQQQTPQSPQSTPQTPSPQTNPPTYSSIKFDIVTGGDDLRSDSKATADVTIAGTLQTFILKDQNEASWGNNSSNSKSFPINGSPQPQSAFGDVKITLQSNDSGLETDDNWNIKAIVISVSDPTGGTAILYSKICVPEIRLTGSMPSTTLHIGTG